MSRLNIYGASGHAKVITESFLSSYPDGIVNFWDDDANKKTCLNYSINHNTSDLDIIQSEFVIGVGDNKIRKKVAVKISDKVVFSKAVIHKSSIVSVSANIGVGTVFFANSVVNANAIIGKHSIVNSAAVVEHDCILGDFVHISPGALLAGNVTVDEGTQIGIGAKVIQGINIGKWCKIGAGAVVIHDVPDGATVVGVPAKII